jgi:anti-sigma regulatory factor (Ser/Thr protein kinase)
MPELAFGMIESRIVLGDPGQVEEEETVPGDPRPIRAELRAGDERLGLIYGHLPATRAWEPADQNLLELFAAEIGVAVRNAQLFAAGDCPERPAARARCGQGRLPARGQPQPPDAADQHPGLRRAARRGARRPAPVDHHRAGRAAVADGPPAADRDPPRVGALRPQAEVLRPRAAHPPRLGGPGRPDVAFSIDDRSQGWLAVADADQLDQVLWALLDNAVKYGQHRPINVEVAVDEPLGRLNLTIIDHGPGVSDQDRPRLFDRFARGAGASAEDGSGLGLYVSRELCRAMAGDLVIEPNRAGVGAVFTVALPGEAPLES